MAAAQHAAGRPELGSVGRDVLRYALTAFLAPEEAARARGVSRSFRQAVPPCVVATVGASRRRGEYVDRWVPLARVGPLPARAVSVTLEGVWGDQGWGNKKGRLGLWVDRGGGGEAAAREREVCGIASHREEPFEVRRGRGDAVVDEAGEGDYVCVEMFAGSGGGHQLILRDVRLVVQLDAQWPGHHDGGRAAKRAK